MLYPKTPAEKRLDQAMRFCEKLAKTYTAADFSALREACRIHALWKREVAACEKRAAKEEKKAVK